VYCCRDSSVGITTRYRLDGPRIVSRWGARFSALVQTGPGVHPATYTDWSWGPPSHIYRLVLGSTQPHIQNGPGVHPATYTEWSWGPSSHIYRMVLGSTQPHIQNGPGVHPATYTLGTVSFPGLKRPGHGADIPPHLEPRLKKE
jgi:hypothetical protein